MTGQLLRALPTLGTSVSSVMFVPDSSSAGAELPATKRGSGGGRLIIGCTAANLIVEWNLAAAGGARRINVNVAGMVRNTAILEDGRLAVVGNNHSIPLFDPLTLKPVASMGPINSYTYAFRSISPGGTPRTWGLSASGFDLRAWDLTTGQEQCVLYSGDYFDRGSMTTSRDGTVVIAKGARVIDLKLPEQFRALSHDSSPSVRAAWYASWGAWSWARQLLMREQAAGHDVPALLLARANWACGDNEGARHAFDLAVRHHEVPDWYAAMCLTVGDVPLTVPPRTSTLRPPDPIETRPLPPPLADGIIAASSVAELKGVIGHDVIVEGVVKESLWSKRAKHLEIVFEGDPDGTPGLICLLSHKNRDAFDAAFEGDAAQAFANARLRIKGNLILYNGKEVSLKGWPEIELEDPKQVTIVK